MELTKSQDKALDAIVAFFNNTDKYFCLSGSPGTGKSFLINNEIKGILDRAKVPYLVTATTNKAAEVLNATTIHSALGIKMEADYTNGKQKFNLSKLKPIYNTVIIIDEASMVDKPLLKVISENTDGCKILFVGDKYQLPAVGASANVFDSYPLVELTDVVRQKDKELLSVINSLKQGVIDNKVVDIPENSRVKYLRSRDEFNAMLDSFNHEDKMLCYTNNSSIGYNLCCRDHYGKDSTFEVGDYCISKTYCECPSSNNAIHAEEELVISNIDNTVYNLTDIIKGIDNLPNIGVKKVWFNGCPTFYLIPTDQSQYKYAIKQTAALKAWRAYFFLKEKICDLRDFYCGTIHSSQGSTYNNVFIDLEDIKTCKATSVKTRLLYVAVSRAKEMVYIYDPSRKS